VAVKPSDIVRWIEWAGGDFLPVPPEMQVTVLLRDGSTEGPARALEFAGENSCWKHCGAGGDIVAYASDLLFASPVAQATERWRDISTAPKDTSREGLRIDIWLEPIPERQALFSHPSTEGRRITDAWYVERSDYAGWRNERSFNGREINWRATHWMPIAAAPAPKAEGEQ
jgi:hypothetical protein